MTEESTDILLRRTLGRQTAPELPSSFEGQVLTRAREDQTRRLSARGRRWMAAYVAVTLLLSVLIIARAGLPAPPPGAVLVLAPLSFAATPAIPGLVRRLIER